MRKRRAIIFDDEPLVLKMLESFFSLRGYEVLSFPEPVACPVFANNDRHCHGQKPCADIMISDFRMPGMNGLELLERQRAKGCALDIRNKAIISGFLDGWEDRVVQMGYALFRKPCQLSELTEWIDACERRMPLSAPLGIPRKEKREPVTIDIGYFLSLHDRRLNGVVTNISNSGFCLATAEDLSQRDFIIVDADLPVSCREASVRWTKRTGEASYMAGLCC